MSGQLTLELEPEELDRRYVCCGQPCGPLPPALTAGPEAAARATQLEAVPWPHAGDCPNPNLGVWIDRATGWPLRRLNCGDDAMRTGRCPGGGTFRARPGLADPYDGACCIDLQRRKAG